MNFDEYLTHRDNVLKTHPDVLDAGETRIVHALGNLRTPVERLALPEHAHRCHLAEFWLDNFGLYRDQNRCTLVSQGVRHSLGLLFKRCAAQGKKVLIPQDVYPAYGEIAAAAGVESSTYPSWTAMGLFRQLQGTPASEQPDVILVTHPLKPRARNAAQPWEIRMLKDWLAQSPQRRIIIDAVYHLAGPFDSVTHDLLETDQAILLHSLSKSWVRPLVMGVALVPPADFDELMPLFRAEPPSQDNLRLAHALLTQDTKFPLQMFGELTKRWANLQDKLLEHGLPVQLDIAVPGYLFTAPISAEELLLKHDVLAIPASVFGSTAQNQCVLSSLAMPGWLQPSAS